LSFQNTTEPLLDTAASPDEAVVFAISRQLASKSGEGFFVSLTQELSRWLGLDSVLIGEINFRDTGYYLRTLAANQDEVIHEAPEFSILNSSYELCLDGQVVVHTSASLKPFVDKDPLLKRLSIATLIVVPLFGEGATPIGLLVFGHSTTLPDLAMLRSMATTFSLPAASELQRYRLDRARLDREERLRLFLDNNTNGMYVLDMYPPMPTQLPLRDQLESIMDVARFVECNQSLAEIYGYQSADDLNNVQLVNLAIEIDHASMLRNFIHGDYQLKEHITQIKNIHGHERWLSHSLTGIVRQGMLRQVLGVVTDITDRMRYIQAIEYQAKHDELTGLPNRHFFTERLEELVSNARQGSSLAAMIMDLNGFKEINDTLGHEIGDALLQAIAQRMLGIVESDGVVLARLGGDEFAILLESVINREQVNQLAIKISEIVKTPFRIRDMNLIVGGSMGIALYPEDSDSVTSLLRHSDIAMYRAKRTGQDYEFYDANYDHYTVRRLSLMTDIRQVVERNELRLFYQPVVSLRSKEIVSFEALVRWQHSEYGLLPPNDFIPLIELTDMIEPMTWWVVETAVAQLAEWQTRGLRYSIAVNISTRNIADDKFPQRLQAILERYGVPGKRLEIEITESALMSDPDNARRVLQQVSALGVPLSIDDYGTGYSSLAYLKSLPLNTLKIDRAFIQHMLQNEQDRIIVASTVQLAHNLGLRVTAEGIEEEAMLESLNTMACDKGQGYHICRPVPIDALEKWIVSYNEAL
jgi:diguanylate cyclase (GGDEF)-like protein/PAS domain S-box-containing protein